MRRSQLSCARIDRIKNELMKQSTENCNYGVCTTFLREISLLQATCSHKNIVSLYNHFIKKGVDDKVDYIYIVMEYVPMNLRQYMEDNTLFHLNNVKKIMR